MAEMIIIKNEEQRTDGCSSVKSYEFCDRKATKQSSLLVRVAVVFCVLGLTSGFPDDDCHREFPYVEGYPHVSSMPRAVRETLASAVRARFLARPAGAKERSVLATSRGGFGRPEMR